MADSLRSLVPFVHVKDVRRSLEFYEKLGFEQVNVLIPDGFSDPVWAYLERWQARLMLAQADGAVIPEQQAVLFYLYFDDVPAVHAGLTELNLDPGPIRYPSYCPKGEFRLTDPDGYCLMITHV